MQTLRSAIRSGSSLRVVAQSLIAWGKGASTTLAVVIALVSFAPISLFGGEGNPTMVPGISLETLPRKDSTVLVLVSDTQSPIWVETLVLSRNKNETARDMIFQAILKDRPAAVVHTGDIVAMGFYPRSWEAADRFVDSLSGRDIPFYPIRGNHELLLFPGAGEENFVARFPFAARTGYLRRIGPLAVVLLNSNFLNLTADEGLEQLAWYKETLERLDGDTSVSAILVGCHHSPYTNSRIVAPSRDVQQLFVPPFLRSSKCRLFVSGHSHAGEHFRVGGKDFLVIGGGGGLQHPLLTGNARRWEDLYPIRSETRMFHYVRCTVTASTIHLSIRMLTEDFSTIDEVLTLELLLHVPESAPTTSSPDTLPGHSAAAAASN